MKPDRGELVAALHACRRKAFPGDQPTMTAEVIAEAASAISADAAATMILRNWPDPEPMEAEQAIDYAQSLSAELGRVLALIRDGLTKPEPAVERCPIHLEPVGDGRVCIACDGGVF